MTTLPARTVTVTLEGVTLDTICFEHAFMALGDHRRAGKLTGYVEAALEANPGLAGRGLVLPRGTVIELPEFAIETAAAPAARLWDE